MALVVRLVEAFTFTLSQKQGGIRIRIPAGGEVDFLDAVATGLHHSINDVVAEQMAVIDRALLKANLPNLQQTFIDTDGLHYSVTYGPNGEATYTSVSSPSVSPSISPSGSLSPSASASASASPSLSPSASTSVSPSASLSPSASVSISPSASLSPSGSLSPSASVSPSSSSSPSRSPSASVSASKSPSASISPSASASPSA